MREASSLNSPPQRHMAIALAIEGCCSRGMLIQGTPLPRKDSPGRLLPGRLAGTSPPGRPPTAASHGGLHVGASGR